MAAGYTTTRGPDPIYALGGDGTVMTIAEVELLSAAAVTVPTRILSIEHVSHSIKTNAGGATSLIWSAGTNDGEVDIQAVGSTGVVTLSILAIGWGTC